jgi:hypothetical protein
MATSNGSLRMSKKGQTRGNGQIDVPRFRVAGTRWWPPFCAADWLAAAVLATEIIAGAGFITSQATGQRQTRVDPETGI